MSIVRGYDNDLEELFCAIKNCSHPPVQTVRMACMPYVQEGDPIDRSRVRYEYVPLCEADYARLFPIRAQHIPKRFIAGL